RKLDVREETVTAAERERNRAILNLDHLAIDLGKQRENLIDDDADGGRRLCLGSEGTAANGDEAGEDQDPRQVTAHAETSASISPRLAHRVWRVKEWGKWNGAWAIPLPMPRAPCRTRRLECQPNPRRQRVGVLRGLLSDQARATGRCAVGAFGSVEPVPREEVAAHEVEGGVRREAPGHPEIGLGAEVVG